MKINHPHIGRYVIGPDGAPLTLSNLPPAGTTRWVIRRKAEVIYAVRGGLLTIDDACARYRLSLEEFLSWQSMIGQHGVQGLRSTQSKNCHQRTKTATARVPKD